MSSVASMSLSGGSEAAFFANFVHRAGVPGEEIVDGSFRGCGDVALSVDANS